ILQSILRCLHHHLLHHPSAPSIHRPPPVAIILEIR
ncbi:unnamed protein product, partial [Tuber aestivum]